MRTGTVVRLACVAVVSALAGLATRLDPVPAAFADAGLLAAMLIPMLLNRRRVVWPDVVRRTSTAYILLIALVIPTHLMLGFGQAHGRRTYEHFGAGFASLALIAAALGAALMIGPLLRVPAIAGFWGVFLSGFVLGGLVMQWSFALDRTRKLDEVKIVAIAAAAIVVASAFPTISRLRPLGRTNEIWYVAAAVVFTTGQVPLVLGSGVIKSATRAVPTIAACSLIAMASLSQRAAVVGSPVASLSTRTRRTTPAITVTLFVTSLGLAVPVMIGWSTSTTIVVSICVVLQAIALAWFCSSDRFYGLGGGGQSPRQMRRDLRSALVENELIAYYQPVFRSSDLSRCGYECLARWQHPRLGLLPAAQFIALAELDDVLDAVDRRMMNLTLDNLDSLLGGLTADRPFVSVNVNPRRFEGSTFVAEVLDALDRRGRDGTGLVFELTESAAVSNWPQLVENVTALQKIGVDIAIDDFGTGHANYRVLLKLEPDIIKLDKLIADASSHGERGRILLRSAVLAASTVGARVVLEGIEDACVIDDLAKLGAEYMQGHALGRAMSVEEIALLPVSAAQV
jgi:EAL domain-containing protein (putative c-di-GMP-specific phosphodiesterase class I)